MNDVELKEMTVSVVSVERPGPTVTSVETVALPAYATQMLDEHVLFRRIDADGRAVTVWVPDDPRMAYRIEIAPGACCFGEHVHYSAGDFDYTFGRGRYACAPEEFERALQQALAAAGIACDAGG